jgi:hypothetical protein
MMKMHSGKAARKSFALRRGAMCGRSLTLDRTRELMSSTPTRSRTSSGSAIVLTLLVLLCGSEVVLGQGGTGRETAPPPKKTATKTTPPRKNPFQRIETASDSHRAFRSEGYGFVKDKSEKHQESDRDRDVMDSARNFHDGFDGYRGTSSI